MSNIIEFDSDWEPLRWQKKVWNQKQRYKVVRVGRRAGKTELGMRWLVYNTLETGKDGLLIAPTDGLLRDLHLKKYFLPFLQPLIETKACYANISKGNISFNFSTRFGGGTILLRGAENVDKRIIGMGKDLNRVWLDEVSRMKDPKYLFSEVLLPMTFDHPIHFLFTSTPHGFDFFKELSERANNPKFRNYWEYYGNSFINPNVKRKEIEALIQEEEWGPIEVKENIFAEFADLSVGVFGNYTKIAEEYEYPVEPEHGHIYLMGMDIATVGDDWTVLYVLDVSVKPAKIVRKERFQKIDPVALEETIVEISKTYNGAKVFTDYTNEKNTTLRLKKRILTEGVNFTPKSKPEMIHNLAYLIQKGAFIYSKSDEDLKNELGVYRGERTHTGKVRYSAPSGYHDDCVACLLVLMWGARKRLKEVKPAAPSFGEEYNPYKDKFRTFNELNRFYKTHIPK